MIEFDSCKTCGYLWRDGNSSHSCTEHELHKKIKALKAENKNMREEIKTQKTYIEMLQFYNGDIQALVDEFFKSRDLTQQAKGVSDFFSAHTPRISMGKSAIWEVDDVLVGEHKDRLLEQAKESGW